MHEQVLAWEVFVIIMIDKFCVRMTFYLFVQACWEALGVESMRQGDFERAEMVYQKIKNLEKLSFFYLMTGNIKKLKRMLQIAEMRKDVHARFNNGKNLPTPYHI